MAAQRKSDQARGAVKESTRALIPRYQAKTDFTVEASVQTPVSKSPSVRMRSLLCLFVYHFTFQLSEQAAVTDAVSSPPSVRYVPTASSISIDFCQLALSYNSFGDGKILRNQFLCKTKYTTRALNLSAAASKGDCC